ncbi:SDR family NAD(P)-dependent oxidoreductase [Methylorubrum thiocyanatum]|uniref:NAD(P)-dependent dehydrogenase (Short-subunit alcohol dehydrogenase family) n=1 Tax=Methylorubrum thiocyanatum TaxID=47958 RepID=A0AA40VD52_9HYPH|nr:SDR family oxidoreductase [Methylorubrum thiocyanatum]MBA8914266.1 NAD(P)-dependent dehydrogenase (short-subunit alcohol dehydrogenase family) [Methylorubrum thiocyanatum]GJE82534.1 Diacetyl reductase [(S)-acetoin forming] [Methylorubrum thiocyanatum]
MERVVIYGGTGGIGLATARALRARGAALHLVGRDSERLERAAAELGETGFTAGDVTDPALFPRVADEVGDRLGGLVYAVGTIQLAPVAKLDPARIEADFRINALGAFLAVQAAVPALKASVAAGAGEGSAGVVLFSTVAAAQGFSHHASVAMAKGAVEGLALSLAAELAPAIRVNVVAPSLTRTPLAESITRNATLASGIASMHALQRLGEPEDVAALAAFLVSPEAGYVTGQVIGVDGGRSSLRTKG